VQVTTRLTLQYGLIFGLGGTAVWLIYLALSKAESPNHKVYNEAFKLVQKNEEAVRLLGKRMKAIGDSHRSLQPMR